MNLAELFSNPGFGVMSTSSSDGKVNSAVYARPHVIDETTLVWGMTDKRTSRTYPEIGTQLTFLRPAAPDSAGCAWPWN